MVLGDQAGVTGCPDCAVRCRQPESAGVFGLERAGTGSGGSVLPSVISRCHLNPYVSDTEVVTDVVTIRGQPFVFHQGSDVLGGVVGASDPSEVSTGGDAVVIVVAVGDEYGVQSRDIPRCDRHLDHDGHVKPPQQGVDHDGGAAAVDQE